MIPEVRDAGVELRPDPTRVVADLFLPGESTPGAVSRAEQVVERVLALPRDEVVTATRRIEEDFGGRHIGLAALLRANAEKVHPASLTEGQQLLLGAAVTAERSVEGAALCNPSVVAHPDQSGMPSGSLRVAVSLRSIGEGHVSSISFCSAVIGPGRRWTFDERSLPLVRALVLDGEWERDHLRRALEHDGGVSEISNAVLQKLPSAVRGSDIEAAISALPAEFFGHYESRERVESIRLVGRSAYRVEFPDDSDLSQRVLRPVADEERGGVEDARFVRFVEDDGSVEYRASYTAYDGREISSRLITTTDFEHFSVHRLTGAGTHTKGMAFFPRRVGGRLLALTRTDGERILLARSDDGLDWGGEVPIAAPEALWEIVQTGNCGSPIETDHGWLVLTHGVGPMRRYSLGAIVLDLDDPTRVIARLDSPLLEPIGAYQDGYVPNVVYSCGALVHDGVLWLPHGVGDGYVRVVSVLVSELIGAMSPA